MNTSLLLIAVAVGAIVVVMLSRSPQARAEARPQAAELRTLYDQGALFVDVRTRGEWQDGHLDKALLLPLQDLESGKLQGLPPAANPTPIVIYCRSGARAGRAAEHLRGLGYSEVIAMSGGYSDLRAAGFPVVE